MREVDRKVRREKSRIKRYNIYGEKDKEGCRGQKGDDSDRGGRMRMEREGGRGEWRQQRSKSSQCFAWPA